MKSSRRSQPTHFTESKRSHSENTLHEHKQTNNAYTTPALSSQTEVTMTDITNSW